MRRLRSWPFLLLRRPEVAVRRLVAILRLLHVPVFRLLHIPVFGLRSSLLLIRPRLRRLHLPGLIVTAIGASVARGLTERLKALLRLHRRLPADRRGPCRSHWTNQP